MKIFTSTQLHELDKYTIEKDQINSIDLMERSAKVLTMAITEEWTDRTPVVIFAGPGNNGGDALAVGRLLLERGYHVKIYLFNTSSTSPRLCGQPPATSRRHSPEDAHRSDDTV